MQAEDSAAQAAEQNVQATPVPHEAPVTPEPYSFRLSEPVEDLDTEWSEVELREANAGDLWMTPAGGSLPLRAQALVGARLIAGLAENRIAPFCKALAAKDFGHLASIGTDAILAYNRANTAMLEELEQLGVDGEDEYTFKLETGFQGRRPGQTQKEQPLVKELTFRPLRGGDVWETPPDNLTLGQIGQVAARACGYPDAHLKRMTPSDFGRALAVTSVFLQPFQAIGRTQ